MVHGHKDQGGMADVVAEDSQNVQQVVLDGVAVFEQIVLDESTSSWPVVARD